MLGLAKLEQGGNSIVENGDQEEEYSYIEEFGATLDQLIEALVSITGI